MKENLIEAINVALKSVGYNGEIPVELSIPKQKENGDFSTNIAMKLAGILHDNPLNLAQRIVKYIECSSIKDIEIKQPGFINFFVNKDYVIDNIKEVLKLKENYGRNTIGDGKKINIEFVSANPTGILHLGNARGGAYGDSLARIMRFCGFDVTSEYYINDAGNQINNLGESIKARYYEICGKNYNFPENGYHGKEIIDIAQEIYDEHKDEYLNQGIDYYKQLGTEKLLNRIIDDLKKYRINYDVFTSEKAIAQKYGLDNIIKELADNGYTYTQDGATWFKCSSIYDDKDHVLIKDDNSYTYLVPDIAYHKDKYSRGYDKMIDILGTDHHGYVARLKSSVKAIGNDPEKLEVKLLQLVRLVDNGEVVKMSKRTGKSITLNDLIDEVGVNAARYYFAKYSLDTQMDFDLNLAKSKSNENPVYYVCYAYARICSILKETNDNDEIPDKFETLNDEWTYNVLEKVYAFKDVVKTAAIKELPHLIINYVYELASLFHTYYGKNKVITDEDEKTKENICVIKCVKYTIYNALNLVGVIPPERM